MNDFNFAAQAELFPTRSRLSKRQPVSYKRFDTAAEAIRYAIEDLPPDLLVGAYLEVDEERFDAQGIRALYEQPAYPLPRGAKASAEKPREAMPVAAMPPQKSPAERKNIAGKKSR
jgi:hypothetical protein